jgi:hypothetical protein
MVFLTLVVLWRTVRTKKNGKQMPEAKFLAADLEIWSTPIAKGCCKLPGRYDNPMPESVISPNQRQRIWPLDLRAISLKSVQCTVHVRISTFFLAINMIRPWTFIT